MSFFDLTMRLFDPLLLIDLGRPGPGSAAGGSDDLSGTGRAKRSSYAYALFTRGQRLGRRLY